MARYQKKDRFHQLAKRDEFAARSVYKLEEIDRRYRLVSKGARLVDLGCAPGSWLQYLAQAIGKKGCVVGYDLEPMEVNPGPSVVTFLEDVEALTVERIRADLFRLVQARKRGADPEAGAADEPGPAPPLRIDGLLSDMAPKLTGIRDADQARSVALNAHALRLADGLVSPGGFFVAKLFQGRDTDGFVSDVKRTFKDVKLLKPEATREGSREVFVVARDRRPHGP